MRKWIFMALLAVSTTAFADEYNYLVLDHNGSVSSVLLENLQKITFEDGNVVLTTTEGKETFSLTQMERMYFSETATAITSVKENTAKSDVVYDLSGRKVVNPTKGLYIVDGKKVVIK